MIIYTFGDQERHASDNMRERELGCQLLVVRQLCLHRLQMETLLQFLVVEIVRRVPVDELSIQLLGLGQTMHIHVD